MNYRHIFHAGNFADVVKHVVLTFILEKLCEKPTPFCVVDTHAGQGIYDLRSPSAQRTQEAEGGILKLLACQDGSLGALFDSYLTIVKHLNAGLGGIRFYPGSPKIAQAFLRAHDRLLLSELHPESCSLLKALFRGERRAQIFERNGYLSLKALLPPLERRGLVLIDPPFEKKDEWTHIAKGLREALKRFAHGIYMIWYPLKDQAVVSAFQQEIHQLYPQNILIIDFYLGTDKLYLGLDREEPLNGLKGCGLIIVNPPWQLREKAQLALQQLLTIMGQEKTGKVLLR
jgi:23S rRNA (adenine2030-N6)-methyltransferase